MQNLTILFKTNSINLYDKSVVIPTLDNDNDIIT